MAATPQLVRSLNRTQTAHPPRPPVMAQFPARAVLVRSPADEGAEIAGSDKDPVALDDGTSLLDTALCLVQEMHGKATETQVLVRPNGITDVSICGVALFVSETIDCHG